MQFVRGIQDFAARGGGEPVWIGIEENKDSHQAGSAWRSEMGFEVVQWRIEIGTHRIRFAGMETQHARWSV